MPTYRYLCNKCAKTLEQMSKMGEKQADYPKCPICKGDMVKIWITPEGGFILKGHGWYKKGGY